MKRILRFFVLISVLVLPLQGFADTATFDFSTDDGLKTLGIAKPDPKQGDESERTGLYCGQCQYVVYQWKYAYARMEC